MGDRDALVYLYEMTQGHTSGWLNESNWNTEVRLNLWHGITVDEGAHVVSCVLGSNRLTGIFTRDGSSQTFSQHALLIPRHQFPLWSGAFV